MRPHHDYESRTEAILALWSALEALGTLPEVEGNQPRNVFDAAWKAERGPYDV